MERVPSGEMAERIRALPHDFNDSFNQPHATQGRTPNKFDSCRLPCSAFNARPLLSCAQGAGGAQSAVRKQALRVSLSRCCHKLDHIMACPVLMVLLSVDRKEGSNISG